MLLHRFWPVYHRWHCGKLWGRSNQSTIRPLKKSKRLFIDIRDSFNKVAQRWGRDITPWCVGVGFTQRDAHNTVQLRFVQTPPGEALSDNHDLQFCTTLHTTRLFPVAAVCLKWKQYPGLPGPCSKKIIPQSFSNHHNTQQVCHFLKVLKIISYHYLYCLSINKQYFIKMSKPIHWRVSTFRAQEDMLVFLHV